MLKIFDSKVFRKIDWMLKGSIPLVYFKWFFLSLIIFCIMNLSLGIVPVSFLRLCIGTIFMCGYLSMIPTLVCIHFRQMDLIRKNRKNNKKSKK
jgi:hypothetical protein